MVSVALRKPVPIREPAAMSATVAPTERLDLYEDPYTVLEQLQESWRERQEKSFQSKDEVSEVDIGAVDWRSYEPPAGISDTQGVDSELLQEIITSSIEQLQTRYEREKKEEAEAAEAQRTAEHAASEEAAKSKEPYLPIIIINESETKRIPIVPDCDPRPRDSIHDDDIYEDDSIGPWDSISVVSATPAKRRHVFQRLFRKHHHNQKLPVQAESSKAGAAREAREAQDAQRQLLNDRLRKVNINLANPQVQQAIADLHRNTSFRIPEKPQLVECVSCLDDFEVKETIRVPCHNYCKECFDRLISAACENEQQWPPKCCLNEIPFRQVLQNIPEELKTKFRQRESEWTTPVSERVYCSRPDCGLWITPDQIDGARRIGHCTNKHTTCTICRGVPHGSNPCPGDQDLNLTNGLAEEEGWKRCARCKILVEHREACQHMTCLCGYQFCYVCTRQWRTCSCTVQELNELKAGVERRREIRRQREAKEAQELREVLEAIAAFEREEERRAEEERLEQQRLEEQRWERLLVERIKKETIRRREVEVKFQTLRIDMSCVHQRQKALVATQQDDLATTTVSEGLASLREMEAQHSVERAEINQTVTGRVAKKAAELDKEYGCRLAEERKSEEAYEKSLLEYWKDHDEEHCDEHVSDALLLYRQQLDEFHQEWQDWRVSELAAYRAKLDDKNAIREELMYSALHRLRGRNRDKDAELAQRLAAEKKWIQEIIIERVRLLDAAEVAEMEGDADSLFTPENIERAETAQVMEAAAAADASQTTETVEITDITDNPWEQAASDGESYGTAPVS